jgi:hypothetical protein
MVAAAAVLWVAVATPLSSPMREDAGDLSWIKPRDVASNPRCPDCSSPDRRHPELPAMFHPRHAPGDCFVQLVGEERCQCGAELVNARL